MVEVDKEAADGKSILNARRGVNSWLLWLRDGSHPVSVVLRCSDYAVHCEKYDPFQTWLQLTAKSH